MFLGTARDIRSLAGGPPLAVQIRSRRSCRSLAAAMQLEVFRVYCDKLDESRLLLSYPVRRPMSS
ncbi:hypothetical protein FCN80_15590 [Martelella alba]|uniref:Uncharacterized protein n=1 Tax=Martelella alba TaxID=2590451 RepID=A0ABY2SLG2_9HYPH|nr:hypothetical protein FCN80_15590 [Martelella alba]